jgi:mevalonate kinase
MPKAISSAPGKVILFGEHAVVYGVTAVAAALSDLRIVVEMVRCSVLFDSNYF